jgi:hypothetical protein
MNDELAAIGSVAAQGDSRSSGSNSSTRRSWRWDQWEGETCGSATEAQGRSEEMPGEFWRARCVEEGIGLRAVAGRGLNGAAILPDTLQSSQSPIRER